MTDAAVFLATARAALDTDRPQTQTLERVYELISKAALIDPSEPEVFLLFYRFHSARAFPRPDQRHQALCLRRALILATSNTTVIGYLAHYQPNERAHWRSLTVLLSPTAAKSVEDLIHTNPHTNRKRALYSWVSCLNPKSGDIHLSHGRFHADSGQNETAIRAFQRCLEHLPLFTAAWFNLGVMLNKHGQFNDAQTAFRKGLIVSPDSANAWFSFGNSVKAMGRQASILFFHKALVINPDHSNALINIGNACRLTDVSPPINHPYRRAALSAPENPQAYVSLGQIYNADLLYAQARKLFRAAAQANPDDPKAQYNLALADLRMGHLQEGWKRHHWGRSIGLPEIVKTIDLPQWHPPSEHEDTTADLLIWNDQIGIGEEIMYLSVLPEILRQTRSCTLICSDRLEPLIRRSFPDIQIVGKHDLRVADLGPNPKQISLIRAVSYFRKSFGDFNAAPRYLKPSAQKRDALRQKYISQTGKPSLIGLSWKSQTGFRRDEKSIPLPEWGTLLKQKGIGFISLQYGESGDDINEAGRKFGANILSDPDIDALHNLDGLTAQIGAMDAVVSISNATVHLAGAIGVPTWMAYPSDISLLWYWFTGRADSPWYPGLRIVRGQKEETRGELMKRTGNDVISFLSSPKT